MFDESLGKRFATLKKFACPVLGFWHPYKAACQLLFAKDVFVCGLFGPLWHSIWPSTGIHLKQRLSKIGRIFMICAYAYSACKDDFQAAKDDETLSDACRSHLVNWVDLFEHFIPAV